MTDEETNKETNEENELIDEAEIFSKNGTFENTELINHHDEKKYTELENDFMAMLDISTNMILNMLSNTSLIENNIELDSIISKMQEEIDELQNNESMDADEIRNTVEEMVDSSVENSLSDIYHYIDIYDFESEIKDMADSSRETIEPEDIENIVMNSCNEGLNRITNKLLGSLDDDLHFAGNLVKTVNKLKDIGLIKNKMEPWEEINNICMESKETNGYGKPYIFQQVGNILKRERTARHEELETYNKNDLIAIGKDMKIHLTIIDEDGNANAYYKNTKKSDLIEHILNMDYPQIN